MPFISFFDVIALARTSRMMLKSINEKGHPFALFMILESYSFSPFKYVSNRFFVDIPYEVEEVPSVPSLLKDFVMSRC